MDKRFWVQVTAIALITVGLTACPQRHSSQQQAVELESTQACSPTAIASQLDQPAQLRVAQIQALRTCGAEGASALQAALADDDWQTRAIAADGLAHSGALNSTPLPALLAATQDPRPEVRASAVRALGRSGSEAVSSTLAAALHDEDELVRTAAAEALTQLEAIAPSVLPVVTRVWLTEGNWLIRQRLAQVLEASGAEAHGVIPLLMPAIDSNDGFLRTVATTVLRHTSAELIDRLKTETDSDQRQQVALTLGKIGSTEALPALIAALQDPDRAGVASAAAAGLGALGSEAAIPELMATIQTATEADSVLIQAAFEALGDIDSDTAVPFLLDRVQQGEPRQATAAIVALGQLRAQAAIPLLLAEIVKDRGDEACQSGYWQAEPAVALAQIGSDEAIAALANALEHYRHTDSAHYLVLVEAVGMRHPQLLIRALTRLNPENPVAALRPAFQQLHSISRDDCLSQGSFLREATVALTQVLAATEPEQVALLDATLPLDEAFPAIADLLELDEITFYSLPDHGEQAHQFAIEYVKRHQATLRPPLRAAVAAEAEAAHLAAQVLGYIGTEADHALLLAAARSDDWDLRTAAVDALGMLRVQQAESWLLEQLRQSTSDDEPYWRHRLAQALAQLRSEAVIPTLLDTLQQQETYHIFRDEAAMALGSMGSPEAVAALGQAYEAEVARVTAQLHPSASTDAIPTPESAETLWVRRAMVHALGQVNSPEAIALLVQALHDPNWLIRQTASEALVGQGSAAVPALVRALAREPATAALTLVLNERAADQRRSAAYVLGQLGEAAQSAVREMAAIAQDDTDHPAVREMAAIALTHLAADPTTFLVDSSRPTPPTVTCADPEQTFDRYAGRCVYPSTWQDPGPGCCGSWGGWYQQLNNLWQRR